MLKLEELEEGELEEDSEVEDWEVAVELGASDVVEDEEAEDSSEEVDPTSVQMRRSEEEGVCEGVDPSKTVELAESLNVGLRLVELVLALEVDVEVSSSVKVRGTSTAELAEEEVDSADEVVLVAFSEADSADKNDLSPVLFECDHRFSTIYSSRRNLLPRKLNQEEKVRN